VAVMGLIMRSDQPGRTVSQFLAQAKLRQ